MSRDMVPLGSLSASPGLRALGRHRARLERGLERLASGTRIRGAADDAAGLATTNRLEAEVRGKSQAIRNLNDGVSMLQTAESALAEVMNGLQRMRELAVQASNGTLTAGDVASLGAELEELGEVIDGIGRTTAYNGRSLFSATTVASPLDTDELTIVEKLRSGWLAESERLIEQYFGITGDGVSLTVTVDAIDGPYGTAAYVSGTIVPAEGTGLGNDLELVIDVDDYAVFGDEYDVIIAHEMVHAVMFRSVNMYDTIDGGVGASTGTWFKEGTAELIGGADARVAGTIATYSEAQLADRVTELLGGAAWGGGGAHGFSVADDYSAGYVAVRYLHDRIKAAGGAGIADVFAYLSQNVGSGVDEALQNLAAGGYAGGVGDFAADWSSGAGLAYIQGMDLANEDTGAIGGADADGGPVRDQASVIPDTYDYREQPLQYFDVVWPSGADVGLEAATGATTIQVGAGAGDGIELGAYAISPSALGLDQVDLTGGAPEAVGRIDRAIDLVSEAQATVGASLNRLESAIAVEASAAAQIRAGLGRIRDLDYAGEAAAVARSRVLEQAAVALLAQANVSGRVVLDLLPA